MKKNEEGISGGEFEFGVFCSGRRYKKLKTEAEKREKHMSTENLVQMSHIV
jgi:hypothetical protein